MLFFVFVPSNSCHLHKQSIKKSETHLHLNHQEIVTIEKETLGLISTNCRIKKELHLLLYQTPCFDFKFPCMQFQSDWVFIFLIVYYFFENIQPLRYQIILVPERTNFLKNKVLSAHAFENVTSHPMASNEYKLFCY